ncbi:MAG TPA: FHA domain-containing protein, partial [Polyangia bacterium]|nr:FHA domain-containing protein [Polyangia bacterium]
APSPAPSGGLPDPRPPAAVANLASAVTPREVPCPNCGEPMLSGWGTTCGRCRPNLVAPKTLFLAPGQMAAAPSQVLSAEGMTLGWLVVVASVDTGRRGALVELTYRRSILSRAGTMPPGTPGVVEFADTFMSSGHAIVTRPQTGNRNEAFEIRDRESAPSANGTFVNSRRLVAGEVMRLGDGDVVKVGATELVFRSLWLPGSGARPS